MSVRRKLSQEEVDAICARHEQREREKKERLERESLQETWSLLRELQEIKRARARLAATTRGKLAAELGINIYALDRWLGSEYQIRHRARQLGVERMARYRKEQGYGIGIES